MSDYFGIHHIRSRFKGEEESILPYIAECLCNIGEMKKDDFDQQFDDDILFHPKNAGKERKTIKNWRTEMTALFALKLEENDTVKPSDLSIDLAKTGDIIQYFRSFLNNFQYPGGYLTTKKIKSYIINGVRFKPAKYILELLVHGTNVNAEDFGVSKEEVTELVFNNLSVTRDGISAEDIYNELIYKRKIGYSFDLNGLPRNFKHLNDEFRYARDIMDYMTFADLLIKKENQKYYPNMSSLEVINKFLSDNTYFEGYDALYGLSHIELDQIKEQKTEWQKYASRKIKIDDAGSSLSYIPGLGETGNTALDGQQDSEIKDLLSRIREVVLDGENTKQTGDLGEYISITHEKNRVEQCGRKDLADSIQKIPDHLGVGYDFRSYSLPLGEKEKIIHIEVKTTKSKNKLQYKTISLTKHEFNAAQSYEDQYYIYRVAISEEGATLFIIQNPWGKIATKQVKMRLSGNGAIITFDESVGRAEEILI